MNANVKQLPGGSQPTGTFGNIPDPKNLAETIHRPAVQELQERRSQPWPQHRHPYRARRRHLLRPRHPGCKRLRQFLRLNPRLPAALFAALSAELPGRFPKTFRWRCSCS